MSIYTIGFGDDQNEPGELTRQQLNRQDYVDNLLTGTVNSLIADIPNTNFIQYDSELIGSIRDHIFDVLCKHEILKEADLIHFYPYIQEGD